LGDHLTIGVEHHRVAGADLVVVGTDAVAEQQEHAVVVGSTRKPAHEPTSPLGPAQLRLARRRVFMSTCPDGRVYRLHTARSQRTTPTRLMPREQDLGA